ncbi:hypothetical protein Tco_0230921 [Tanacetum coccineum]
MVKSDGGPWLRLCLGDDWSFEDDALDGFDVEELKRATLPSVYEVGGPSTAAAEGPSFPHSASGLLVPPAVIEDLSTRLGNLEYGHGQLVQKVMQVGDVEVAAGVTIGEIGPRVFAVEGQGQQTAAQRDEMIAELTQQVQALQEEVQQRDTQIQQLQTTVTKMGSRESTLMQCIMGMDRRLEKLERRPPGPQ